MKQQKFKQTEVGLIPEDWEVKNIQDISSELVRGPFGGSLKKECFVNSGIKIYEQKNAICADVEIGDYYIDNIKFNELKRFELKAGDFIISCSGTIGKIFQMPKKFEKGIINQALLKIKINPSCCSENYFLHYFRWERFQKKIIESIQGGAMKNLIGMPEFKKTIILLPKDLNEQSAIASVLSDTGTLIESLDKLITKKKNIKQGAMQELLTGKRRLPGFKGELETKKLGDVADFYNGKAHERFISDNGEYIVVNSKFISTESEVYKNSLLNFFPLKEKDITMVMSDIPNGKALAKCFIIPKNDKYALNQRICVIRTNSVEYKFLYFILNRNKYYLAFDSGSGQTNLKKNNVLDCPIKLPPTIEEQSAIAQILSDMDAEIEELERKKDKYQKIKIGMMQELLTGRIRLI
jgi:type I restriction enzyme S subunit